MKFVQIIDYETEQPDEFKALGEERRQAAGDADTATRGMVLRDRDNPNRYYVVVEFDSYEDAMRNSELPETQKFAEQAAQLCTRPTRFINCDLIDVMET